MKRFFQRNSRLRGNGQSGQALLEFAIVGLVFLMFVFSILDGARLFQSWVTVQHAAREGARYAITGQSACATLGGTQTRNACIVTTAKARTNGMAKGGVSSPDVTVKCKSWAYTGGTWPDNATAFTNDCSTAASIGSQCDAVEVDVAVTHTFISPILMALRPGGVTLTGKQRMINEPFGPCT